MFADAEEKLMRELDIVEIIKRQRIVMMLMRQFTTTSQRELVKFFDWYTCHHDYDKDQEVKNTSLKNRRYTVVGEARPEVDAGFSSSDLSADGKFGELLNESQFANKGEGK